jgi:two-component system KDP operon response regulator KdpE
MIKHSETILVVEDDAQIRNFITYTLKQEGFPCLPECPDPIGIRAN